MAYEGARDVAEPVAVNLEELLRSAYGAVMTPVPRIQEADTAEIDRWMAVLKGLSGPSMPSQLPVMPMDWQRYAVERGLVPAGTEPGLGGLQRSPPVPPVVEQEVPRITVTAKRMTTDEARAYDAAQLQKRIRAP